MIILSAVGFEPNECYTTVTKKISFLWLPKARSQLRVRSWSSKSKKNGTFVIVAKKHRYSHIGFGSGPAKGNKKISFLELQKDTVALNTCTCIGFARGPAKGNKNISFLLLQKDTDPLDCGFDRGPAESDKTKRRSLSLPKRNHGLRFRLKQKRYRSFVVAKNDTVSIAGSTVGQLKQKKRGR